MAAPSAGTKIVLQVGAEFRIRKNGDLIMDNPELELEREERAADAVLLYRFEASTGEHVLRLLDPVADKLLISSAFISLVQLQVVPAWMVVIIIGREFAVTGLRSIAATEGVIISASKMGKFKMVAARW